MALQALWRGPEGGGGLQDWAEEGGDKFSVFGLELPADLDPTPALLRNKWASARLGVTELRIPKMKKACEQVVRLIQNRRYLPSWSQEIRLLGVGVQPL